VRLRNQWIAIDPRDGQERNDMTINVGLGTGSKAQQLSHVMAVIGLQRDALAAGKSNLVSDDNLFNAAREVTRLVGLKKVDNFFTDPKTQPAPAPAMPGGVPGLSLIELQQRAALEKMQADIAAQGRKLEGDMLLAQQKFALERELKLLDAQIKREQQQQAIAAKIIASAGAATTPAKSADGTADDAAEGGGQGAAAVDAGALVATLMDTLRQMTAPKRIVKNPDGSYTTHPIEPQ
jgi:hypothetical protein